MLKESLEGVIFDLDGTLYPFENSNNYYQSNLYLCMRSNAITYLSNSLSVSIDKSRLIFDYILQRYNGELSLGMEKEFGINRYDWFENTWQVDPTKVIKVFDSRLVEKIQNLPYKIVLLTAAPKVWTEIVLEYLGLKLAFGDNIVTGESDIRKPNKSAFLNAAEKISILPQNIVSIGDQEKTDILPAKNLGMKTIRIGDGESEADFIAKDIIDALDYLEQLNIAQAN